MLLLVLLYSCSSETKQETKEVSNTIPGLVPVDIYLNLEKQGFTTDKDFSSKPIAFISKKSIEGIGYTVETYCPDVNSVNYIRITSIIDPSQKKIVAVKPFLKYMATLRYANANPEASIDWVDRNFNSEIADTIINDVFFKIASPSNTTRLMYIKHKDYN